MTEGREEFETVGTAEVLSRLNREYETIDARLLVDGFPWWQRCLAWCLWRTPIRYLLRRRFVSPYALVRARMRARPRKGDAPGESEQAPVDASPSRDVRERSGPEG